MTRAVHEDVTRRLKHQLEVMEQVEVRCMLSLACYEAIAGPLETELLRRVHDKLFDEKFKNKADMYNQMVATAKTAQFELECEAAELEKKEESDKLDTEMSED